MKKVYRILHKGLRFYYHPKEIFISNKKGKFYFHKNKTPFECIKENYISVKLPYEEIFNEVYNLLYEKLPNGKYKIPKSEFIKEELDLDFNKVVPIKYYEFDGTENTNFIND